MPKSRRDYLKLSAAASGLALAATSARAAAAPRKLRILILGGTGFIGPNQVRYALSRGHEVTIFNRGKQPQEWPGRVEELLGDRNTGDLKVLEGREWDVCIDNPTTLPFWVRDARQGAEGQGEALCLHLDDLGLRSQRQAGRRERRAGALHGQGRHGRDAGDRAGPATARSMAR